MSARTAAAAERYRDRITETSEEYGNLLSLAMVAETDERIRRTATTGILRAEVLG